MNSEGKNGVESRYRIGAVSKLTGVATDTLRVWERRYGAVVPHRSERGVRLYTHQDVARLALIKRLVDGGDAISVVANLALEQLQERAEGLREGSETRLDRPCRVVVLGAALTERLAGDDDIDIVGKFRDPDRFVAEAPALDADVAVLEYPTLQLQQVREIGNLLLRSGVGRAIVVYHWAARTTLDRLESPRIVPARAPLDRRGLRRWCAALHASGDRDQDRTLPAEVNLAGRVPARLFDEATLARIAAASATMRCECPHHLVDLIVNLAAFETYSQECEILNVDDAALHAFLNAAAGQARSLLETALERVVEADAIEF